jgi:hypothetical protein
MFLTLIFNKYVGRGCRNVNSFANVFLFMYKELECCTEYAYVLERILGDTDRNTAVCIMDSKILFANVACKPVWELSLTCKSTPYSVSCGNILEWILQSPLWHGAVRHVCCVFCVNQWTRFTKWMQRDILCYYGSLFSALDLKFNIIFTSLETIIK